MKEKIYVIYKPSVSSAKARYFFNHILDNKEIQYISDNNMIITESRDVLLLTPFISHQTLIGENCDLIYFDKNLSIENILELEGRYKDLLFF